MDCTSRTEASPPSVRTRWGWPGSPGTIVALLPDGGWKYLSAGTYSTNLDEMEEALEGGVGRESARDCEPGDRACRSQQQTLRDHLVNELPPPGAQRADFPPSVEICHFPPGPGKAVT